MLTITVTIILFVLSHQATPDFQISNYPLSGKIESGLKLQTAVTIKSIAGYKPAVTLTANGQPHGVAVDFQPVVGAYPKFYSTVTMDVSSSAQPGNYTITITGRGEDGKERICKYDLTVVGGTMPTLTTLVDPPGTGTVQPSSSNYKEGSIVTLTATPSSSSYIFDHWTGTDDNSINPTNVTMTGNRSVTAYFNPSAFGATITQPTNKAAVSQFITVSGTATSEVPAGQYLWVVVQYGQEIWPQTAHITPLLSPTNKTYEWFVPAQVGADTDNGKPFGIGALLVPQGIDDNFAKWFDSGKKTGQWSGFDLSTLTGKGAKMLASVSVTRE